MLGWDSIFVKTKSVFTMKRFVTALLCVLGVLLFASSCNKDSNEGSKEKTFTVKVSENSGGVTIYGVRMFECAENGDKIGNQKCGALAAGESHTFTITNPHTVKVKLYCDYKFGFGTTFSRWIPQVFYLDSTKEYVITTDVDFAMDEP